MTLVHDANGLLGMLLGQANVYYWIDALALDQNDMANEHFEEHVQSEAQHRAQDQATAQLQQNSKRLHSCALRTHAGAIAASQGVVLAMAPTIQQPLALTRMWCLSVPRAPP